MPSEGTPVIWICGHANKALLTLASSCCPSSPPFASLIPTTLASLFYLGLFSSFPSCSFVPGASSSWIICLFVHRVSSLSPFLSQQKCYKLRETFNKHIKLFSLPLPHVLSSWNVKNVNLIIGFIVWVPISLTAISLSGIPGIVCIDQSSSNKWINELIKS